MKSITIAGNCTKDAETKTTQGGNSVTSWAIAVNGFANGEKTTMFFDVQFWGKRGESAKQFAVKGAKMVVTGDLSTREYNGKTYLQVNGAEFTPMSSKPADDGGGRTSGRASGDGYSAPPSAGAAGVNDMEDSIPFAPAWC